MATVNADEGADILMGAASGDLLNGLGGNDGLRGQRPVLRPETGHGPGATVKAAQSRGFAHAP